MTDYLYDELTGTILAAYYRVFYDLRHRAGYSEENLVQALAHELEARGLAVRRQVAVERRYKGRRVGTDFVDLLVDEVVPLEVKKARSLTARDAAQLRTYLLDGGWAVGLLLNFGAPRPQHRRLYEAANDPTREEEDEEEDW